MWINIESRLGLQKERRWVKKNMTRRKTVNSMTRRKTVNSMTRRKTVNSMTRRKTVNSDLILLSGHYLRRLE